MKAWRSIPFCPTLLTHPTSNAPADVDRRAAVRARVLDFNSVLAQVCTEYPQCTTDAGAAFRAHVTAAEFSTHDYWHPSIAGQAARRGSSGTRSGTDRERSAAPSPCMPARRSDASGRDRMAACPVKGTPSPSLHHGGTRLRASPTPGSWHYARDPDGLTISGTRVSRTALASHRGGSEGRRPPGSGPAIGESTHRTHGHRDRPSPPS